MYRSPIAISGLNPADLTEHTSPRTALLLARRKLEAELELSGGDVAEVAGTALTRQDIITIFDELGDAKKLPYHLAIAGDPPLQRFLETGQVEPGARWQLPDLYRDADFLAFVSPYYAEATDVLYRSVLKREQGTDALQMLAANPSLMLGGDAERAFRSVTRYFVDLKNALLHLLYEAGAGHHYTPDQIRAAAPGEDLFVLNSLPDGFEHLRYEIASALNNICVAFDKRGRPKPALAAIERAAIIQLSGGELMTLIPNNLRLVRNKQPGFRFFNYDNNGKKSPKIGAIIAVFVLIIRIFAGTQGCNDTSYRAAPEFRALEQKPMMHGYHANVSTLLNELAGSNSAQGLPATDTLPLSKPTEADAPFLALYNVIETDDAAALAEDEHAPKNEVWFVNRSPWDIIIFYSRDHSNAGSLYVPPGKTKTLEYTTPDIWIDFTAGKSWDPSATRLIPEHLNSFTMKTHRVTGWYRDRPANLSDFIQPDASLIAAAYDSASKSALVLTFTSTGHPADSLTLNVDTALIQQPAARISQARFR